LLGDDPFYLKFLAKLTPFEQKRRFSIDIRFSCNIYQKSSINTNRKSTTRFPVSLRWTSYVVPSAQIGCKTQNGPFRLRLHCAWRKSATKFLCV